MIYKNLRIFEKLKFKTMKTKHILLPLLINTVLYLLASFIAVDFDFRNWDIVGRFITAWLLICGTTAGIILANEIKTKK